MRKTKIICTLGPNAENYETLKELSRYMDIGRFNFSHGSYDEHLKKLELLKKVRKDVGRPIPALLDTKGPEIRTGLNKNNEKINLIEGSNISIVANDTLCDEKTISVSYSGIINDVKISDTILIDDGKISLKVLSKTQDKIECEVLAGGLLGEHKGVNLPGVRIKLPDLTEKDIQDIEFAIENDFDIIAASFVRSANCIKQIKDILAKHNSNILVIAKIENEEGIENLDSIIDESDGIMVARGDLGVEVNATEVPYLQKQIIKKCNEKGKVVITATQMLDSMINNPRPTRAEVTDVANAIYDGTDVIMLSGETANGKYPIESVKTMHDIAVETEKHINNLRKTYNLYQSNVKQTITSVVCKSITVAANELNAAAIITPTISGRTAKVLSKYKPNEPIYALSTNEKIVRQLMLYYGVTPFHFNRPDGSDAIVGDAIVQLRDNGIVKIGDTVVVAFGRSIEENEITIKPHTNTMRVETVY